VLGVSNGAEHVRFSALCCVSQIRTLPHHEGNSMSPRWTPLAIIFFATALIAMPSSAIASSDSDATASEIGVGVQLLNVSADLQSDPRAQTYIIDNLPPGSTIERSVRVSNKSTTAQTVSVYSGAATVSEGSFQVDDGATQNELSSWTVPSQSDVTLEPGASADLLVTIAVPADAAEGEQYAALWAEVKSNPDASNNVVTANRAGIRMYVSIGAGNGPAASFAIDSLTSARDDAGAPQVIAAVTNSGGRAVDIRGELSLTNGPSSLSAGPFDITETTTLAPGESGEVSVTLDDALPNGPWDASLTLTSGLLSEEASATITFPDAGTGDTVVVEDNEPNWLVIGGGIVLALLLLAIAARFWIRHRTPTARP
jgi:hypothetical protein